MAAPSMKFGISVISSTKTYLTPDRMSGSRIRQLLQPQLQGLATDDPLAHVRHFACLDILAPTPAVLAPLKIIADLARNRLRAQRSFSR